MKRISDKTFKKEVLQGDKVTLVQFCADWSGACHINKKTLEQLELKYRESIQVYEMNIDHNPITSSEMGVGQIPVVLLFEKGLVVDRINGLISVSSLEAKIQNLIA